MTTQQFNKKVRRSLRLLAALTLVWMLIFRVFIPVGKNQELVLYPNDGYVIGSAITILLAVGAVRLLAIRAASGIGDKFFGKDKNK